MVDTYDLFGLLIYYLYLCDMKKYKWTKERLKKAILNANSKTEILQNMNLKPSGGNYTNLNIHLKLYNLTIKGYKGRFWAKGLTKETHPTINKISQKLKTPNNEVFKENSTYTSSRLGKRLLEIGWKYECKVCKLITWLDKPITLHVDHINGIKGDNRLENLRFLCPNCHQQTDTWGYKGNNKPKCHKSELVE